MLRSRPRADPRQEGASSRKLHYPSLMSRLDYHTETNTTITRRRFLHRLWFETRLDEDDHAFFSMHIMWCKCRGGCSNFHYSLQITDPCSSNFPSRRKHIGLMKIRACRKKVSRTPSTCKHGLLSTENRPVDTAPPRRQPLELTRYVRGARGCTRRARNYQWSDHWSGRSRPVST